MPLRVPDLSAALEQHSVPDTHGGGEPSAPAPAYSRPASIPPPYAQPPADGEQKAPRRGYLSSIREAYAPPARPTGLDERLPPLPPRPCPRPSEPRQAQGERTITGPQTELLPAGSERPSESRPAQGQRTIADPQKEKETMEGARKEDMKSQPQPGCLSFMRSWLSWTPCRPAPPSPSPDLTEKMIAQMDAYDEEKGKRASTSSSSSSATATASPPPKQPPTEKAKPTPPSPTPPLNPGALPPHEADPRLPSTTKSAHARLSRSIFADHAYALQGIGALIPPDYAYRDHQRPLPTYLLPNFRPPVGQVPPVEQVLEGAHVILPEAVFAVLTWPHSLSIMVTERSDVGKVQEAWTQSLRNAFLGQAVGAPYVGGRVASGGREEEAEGKQAKGKEAEEAADDRGELVIPPALPLPFQPRPTEHFDHLLPALLRLRPPVDVVQALGAWIEQLATLRAAHSPWAHGRAMSRLRGRMVAETGHGSPSALEAGARRTVVEEWSEGVAAENAVDRGVGELERAYAAARRRRDERRAEREGPEEEESLFEVLAGSDGRREEEDGVLLEGVLGSGAGRTEEEGTGKGKRKEKQAETGDGKEDVPETASDWAAAVRMAIDRAADGQ